MYENQESRSDAVEKLGLCDDVNVNCSTAINHAFWVTVFFWRELKSFFKTLEGNGRDS